MIGAATVLYGILAEYWKRNAPWSCDVGLEPRLPQCVFDGLFLVHPV